ncbi:MAG: type II toxin-antitoxin system VapC family toxin [Marmoricola sp.]
MILLDTQVLLWLVTDDDSLGTGSRRLIENHPGRVHYSPLSLFELTLKQMLGRLRIPDGLDELLRDQGLAPLPVTDRHALAVARFGELVRHDPLDRLLLGQAAAERGDFLTADRRLLSLGLDWVHDAAR